MSVPAPVRRRSILVPVSILLAAYAVLPPTVVRAQCVPYASYLHWKQFVEMPDNAWDVDVSGDYGYVATHDGLVVLDLADPDRAVVATQWDTASPCFSVDTQGDLAVLVEGMSSITLVDISVPEAPAELSHFGLGGAIDRVEISGSLVYVSRESGNRLYIVDISTPETPVVTGSADLPGTPHGMSVDGPYTYLSLNNGFAVVDVADPAAPFVTASIPGWTLAFGMDVSGPHAFVAGGTLIHVVDISDPYDPTIVTSVPADFAYDIELAGDRAFVSEYLNGLLVLDISDPTLPTFVGAIPTKGNDATGLDVDANRVYVAAYVSGLQIIGFDAVAPPPALVGSTTIAGDAACLASADHITCVGADGLQVFDTSDAYDPVLVGELAVATPIEDIDISGTRAYVATSTALQIVDLTDPSMPQVLGSHVTPGLKTAVEVAGPWALLARYQALGGGWYLDTIDVSDPASPSVAGTVPLGSLADLAADGTWAYTPGGFTGALRVIDFADPHAPVVATTIPLPRTTFHVAVSGSRACLTGSDALYVVDISDPGAPTYLGETGLPGPPRQLVLTGTTAYVADASWGVQVVDISVVPPVVVGTYDAEGEAVAIAESDGWIQVADRSTGLSTLRMLAPQCTAAAVDAPFAVVSSGLSVGAVWPQPSLGAQRLPLTLPTSVRLRVRVLDVRGAVVRTLVDGRLDGGASTLVWDGRDTAGRPVAAGVYFFRGDGGASFARKAVRLR